MASILHFSVIRARAPVGGPDDLLIAATIANFSSFPIGLLVLPDQDIVLDAPLVNVSTLGALRVTTGDDFDILLDATLVNVSDVNPTDDLEVQNPGPDQNIYLDATLVNISVVNPDDELEVAEAPPDEYLYPTQIVNVSDVNPTDDLEVQEVSPYDVDLVAPMITNESVLSDLVVQLSDEDPIAGASLAGGTVS